MGALRIGAPGRGTAGRAPCLGAALLPAALALAAPAPLQAAPSASPPRTIALSNERTLTVWAHPAAVAAVRSSPSRSAHRLAALHLFTEDGYPEVYMLLRERIGPAGQAWVRLRIPGRPNGRTGWVPRSALGRFRMTRWQLVVDRAARTLSAYFDGRLRYRAPVGVGAPATPTPAGHFWIREKFAIEDPASGYWPDAFGTADYSTLSEWPGGGVVGIHGPYGQPQAIPGDPSHGCIRMLPPAVTWLYRHIPVGAALLVR